MEHPFMFLLELSIIYSGSFLFALLAKKNKQPIVLGYILWGLVLGLLFGTQTPLSFFSNALFGFQINGNSEILYGLSQLGVILLLFSAGLETNVRELKKTGIRAGATAIGGVIVSGFFIGSVYFIFNANIAEALFMAVIGTATSVSISVQTLKEIGQLKSTNGVTITGAAIIDDIIGIMLVTILGVFLTPISVVDNPIYIVLYGIILFKIILFFIITIVIGFIITKISRNKVIKRIVLGLSYEFVIAALILCFLLAFIADSLGIAAIIGSYFAGLIISMNSFRHIVVSKIAFITQIFFAPIFFSSIGLTLDFKNISGVLILGVFISIIAIAGKIIGCGLGAKFSGFNVRDSIKIGAGMLPRGEAALIIAGLGVQMGILSGANVAVSVLIVVITAVTTPILLKIAFNKL